MRSVQQTDLHCELTGLNVLRGLSGKPEPGCLNAEADCELLSATLKSLTISSMTGIFEGSSSTPLIWHAPISHMRKSLHLYTRRHTQMKSIQIQILDSEWVSDIFLAFNITQPH